MSQITVENIKRSTETASRSTRGVAAAWVNFDGTGTIAARDSENVSSLTDNGIGLYAYNLTNAMNATDYMCGSNGASTSITTSIRCAASIPSSTSQVLIGMRNMGNTASDAENMHGSIHGDLA